MTFAAFGHLALRTVAVLAISVAILIANGTAPVCAQDYAAIIAQADRTEADRVTDKRRDPVNLLTFTGAKTGWRVLDMERALAIAQSSWPVAQVRRGAFTGKLTRNPRNCARR